MNNASNNCDCSLCKNNHNIKVTDELLNELLRGNVTLFAGAGISTESRLVLKNTFHESVAHEVNKSVSEHSFPELMEEYCRQPNGRIKLLKKIKDRLDHIDSFPELTHSATRFHQELGTFFPIKNIVTTNWDTYFEEFCKATPFVTDPDIAFWNAAERRVLKIHGSITNYGSIVATSSDYQQCQDRLNSSLIGGLLKTILATQTVIFIGYSLSDPDFSAIYEFVKKQMNSLHKQAYVVSPFTDECERFEAEGFISIRTDGAYFLKQIKAHALAKKLMLDDGIYDSAYKLREEVMAAHILLHESIKASNFPEVIFSTSYQDGLMHSLERAIAMRGSGEYSHHCRTIGIIETYVELQKEKLRLGIYEDVAYIEGYVNGLTFLLMAKETRESVKVPLYYIFGKKVEINDIDTFTNQLKSNPKIHKAARKRGLACLSKLSDPKSVAFHHPP